jgi:hypothetical protein
MDIDAAIDNASLDNRPFEGAPNRVVNVRFLSHDGNLGEFQLCLSDPLNQVSKVNLGVPTSPR